jgi:hypothetical protein
MVSHIPTTITMAFFRAGYPVGYMPIIASKRIGSSHIQPLKDGLRFLLIIFKIGTLYSPLKLFLPIAVLHGMLGLGYYAYTYSTASRLSVATIFMLTAAVTIFLDRISVGTNHCADVQRFGRRPEQSVISRYLRS